MRGLAVRPKVDERRSGFAGGLGVREVEQQVLHEDHASPQWLRQPERPSWLERQVNSEQGISKGLEASNATPLTMWIRTMGSWTVTSLLLRR